jgi:Ser/Thr protein kinase RdoA (MazF antagonist)
MLHNKPVMVGTAHHAEWHLSDELRAITEQEYRCPIDGAEVLKGGYESAVFLVDCGNDLRVLKIGPKWRSSAELEWSYRLAANAACAMPEVSVPFVTRDRRLVTRRAGRPISLWPFIEGRKPDVGSTPDRDLTALMLASLQRQLAMCLPSIRRPATSPRAPMQQARMMPNALKDRELDRWLADRRATQPIPRGPIHGDYWSNNLILRGAKIVGIIDWDDARIGSLDRELSCAVWEFCAAPSQQKLDVGSATRFLDVYGENGGPVPVKDRTFVVPLIREHLRYEIRRALVAEESGETFEEGNMDHNKTAFEFLRGVSL